MCVCVPVLSLHVTCYQSIFLQTRQPRHKQLSNLSVFTRRIELRCELWPSDPKAYVFPQHLLLSWVNACILQHAVMSTMAVIPARYVRASTREGPLRPGSGARLSDSLQRRTCLRRVLKDRQRVFSQRRWRRGLWAGLPAGRRTQLGDAWLVGGTAGVRIGLQARV